MKRQNDLFSRKAQMFTEMVQIVLNRHTNLDPWNCDYVIMPFSARKQVTDKMGNERIHSSAGMRVFMTKDNRTRNRIPEPGDSFNTTMKGPEWEKHINDLLDMSMAKAGTVSSTVGQWMEREREYQPHYTIAVTDPAWSDRDQEGQWPREDFSKLDAMIAHMWEYCVFERDEFRRRFSEICVVIEPIAPMYINAKAS